MSDSLEQEFDSFLTFEFDNYRRPKFSTQDDKMKAALCWKIADNKARGYNRKINDFRLAFSSLTGIT